MRQKRLLLGFVSLLGVGLACLLLVVWFLRTETCAPDAVHFFNDRSHSELEHAFAVRDRESFAQVAVFPGYTKRRWYHCQHLPDDLFEQVKTWAVRRGDISPPFLPGGPLYARFTFHPEEKRRGEAWFSNDNQEVQEWFWALQGTLIREEYRVNTLPDWVTGDERIKRHFGLWDDDRE